ncbi:cytochrome C oxidase subunit IV family protein [Desmospora profundinema]|uniref:Cytochrome c oxidase subunit 4 n=1 Tax=Desmospora profundinema TaxID=1571184 RepID=A0ABU1IMV3_9BACL|nr:cytochrome C oxidase subunit IV family protein [Desmospora profundinema]MDR6226026.1 cytochrome c oxidase subunit 4 [Desmospora profundinema]
MTHTDHRENTRPRETSGKHIRAFGWMILLTAIAFAAVATEYLPRGLTLTVILVLAAIQTVLQLATFMHLDRRHQLPILFMVSGLGFSVIIAVAIWWLRG